MELTPLVLHDINTALDNISSQPLEAAHTHVQVQMVNALLEQVGAIYTALCQSRDNSDTLAKSTTCLTEFFEHHIKHASKYPPMIRFKIVDIAERMRIV